MRFRELRDRSVDLMVGRIPDPPLDDDLHADILFQDRLIIGAGHSSPWAHRRSISVEELLDERGSTFRQIRRSMHSWWRSRERALANRASPLPPSLCSGTLSPLRRARGKPPQATFVSGFCATMNSTCEALPESAVTEYVSSCPCIAPWNTEKRWCVVIPSVTMWTLSAGPLRFTRGTSNVKLVEPLSTVIWIVTVTSVPSGDGALWISLPVKLRVRNGEA